MDNDERMKARRLGAALRKTSALSPDEARLRLPELVMAELAGEDVERSYADVLVAIDQSPELAEEYAMLVEAMEADLAGQGPVPFPASMPQFFGEARARTPGVTLRRIGEQLQGWLVQLQPWLLPEPVHGMVRETSATYMSSVEYSSDLLSDDDEPVELTALVQRSGTAWTLIVSLDPASETTWRVSASLGESDLPVLSQEHAVTRFGPLDDLPQQPITLLLLPA